MGEYAKRTAMRMLNAMWTDSLSGDRLQLPCPRRPLNDLGLDRLKRSNKTFQTFTNVEDSIEQAS